MARTTRRSKPGEHLIRWFLVGVAATATVAFALGVLSAVTL